MLKWLINLLKEAKINKSIKVDIFKKKSFKNTCKNKGHGRKQYK